MSNLVLTRRLGETIVIGDAIEVTVQGVTGKSVKLSIRAPREVHIVRKEIQNRVPDR